jgi:hypothetical protein
LKETHSIRSFARLVFEARRCRLILERLGASHERLTRLRLREDKVDRAIAEILGSDLPCDEEE